MILLLYLGRQKKSETKPAPVEAAEAVDPFETFCDIHNLTPREWDVMHLQEE
jgi:hypothetical protein